MKRLAMVAANMMILKGASAANAQWHFGVGTGLSATILDATQGLHSKILDVPLEFEVKLDPEEYSDLMSTAFGLGGYATNGKVMITAQGGVIGLEGDGSGVTPEGNDFSMATTFDIALFEAHVGYFAYRSSNMKFSLMPYVGLIYTSHQIENDVTLDADTVVAEFDNSWVDGIIGASIGSHDQFRPHRPGPPRRRRPQAGRSCAGLLRCAWPLSRRPD